MTVSAQTDRFNEIAGSGTSGPFTFTFRILAETDLVVKKTTAAGVTTTLTGNTITGVGDAGGGTVTTAAVVASGDTLLIYANTALTQGADYISGAAFPAESHETALDKLTLIAQDHKRDIERSFKVSMGDDAPADTTWDDLIEEAGAAVGADALAQVEAAGDAQVVLINAAGAAVTGVGGTIDVREDTALTAIDDAADARILDIGAAVGSTIYEDTTAGLAAAASGDYFWVKGDGTNQLAKLYKDNAGVADFVADAPSTTAALAAQAAAEAAAANARGPVGMHTSGLIAQWLFDQTGTTVEDVTGAYDIDLTTPTSQNYYHTAHGLTTEGGLIQTSSITNARTVAIVYRTKRGSTGGFLISGGSASGSGPSQEAITTGEGVYYYGGGEAVHPVAFRASNGLGAYELNRGGWGVLFREMGSAYTTILGFGGRHSTTTSRCDEFEIGWAGVWDDTLSDAERTTIYNALRPFMAKRGVYLNWRDCPQIVDAVVQVGESTADGRSKIVDLSAGDQALKFRNVFIQPGNNSTNYASPDAFVLGENQQVTAPTTDFGPEFGLATSKKAAVAASTRHLYICKYARGSTFLAPSATGATAPTWNTVELPTSGLFYMALRHWQDMEQRLRRQGIGAKPCGMLILIGINDSQNTAYTTDAATYQDYLQDFYDAWKSYTGLATMNIVVVKAHNHSPDSNATANGHVRTAQADFVTANSTYATLYDADALALAADSVHFTAASSKTIGAAAYTAFGL